MSAMASQITSLTIVYSIVYSGANQRKHQSSASLVFVRGIHRWPVNSPHIRPGSNAENVSNWWRHHGGNFSCHWTVTSNIWRQWFSLDLTQYSQWTNVAIVHRRIHASYTGGNRAKLPSSRWRQRGRSLREVFACSRLFATTDLSQIFYIVTRGHGTPCTKTTYSYPFSFLYNNLRKIRRETTVGEKPGRR